uniref:Uncharacterized protein n=1 Tax=Anguilla anguilla TaxID=7936 RepID=A0A0E9WLS6_ANGAN
MEDRGMPLWPFVIFGADGQAAIFCACYFIVAATNCPSKSGGGSEKSDKKNTFVEDLHSILWFW